MRRRFQKRNPDDDGGEPLLDCTDPRRSALDRIRDLLARRNYSELELRRKLSEGGFATEETELAIEFARKHKWLLPPEELAEQLAAALGRRHKGTHYINRYLQDKGLPPVALDEDAEVEKGRAVVRAKLASDRPIDYEDQKRVFRWLASRGFESDTIRRVIESFKGQ